MKSSEQFKPAWWLPGPHLQTIWAARHFPKTNFKLRRERFELADGDFLDLDWLDNKPKSPRVLLIHGLTGCLDAPYMHRILQAIKNQGWSAIVLHLRGCSGEPNRLARTYHAGETGDLQTVIAELMRLNKHTPLAVVGYSMGGNMLLKWLGETREHNPLTAAVAVSVPFELDKAAHQLGRGASRLYQWWLLRNLREFVLMKFKNSSAPFDVNEIYQLRNFWQFDDKITAPLNGFGSAKDYYHQSSSRQFLQFIKKPTLIVHAKDDPFMSKDVIPSQSELSKYVNLEITESGGHVGFVSGSIPGKPVYWLEMRIIEYLKSHFC